MRLKEIRERDTIKNLNPTKTNKTKTFFCEFENRVDLY